MNYSENISSTTEPNTRWNESQRSQAEKSGSAINHFKTTLADQLQNTAQRLHEKVNSTNNSNDLTKFGKKAANWLDRSAVYVNEMQPEQIKSDLENQVRRNPGRSLLIAGVAGVVLARVFRRR